MILKRCFSFLPQLAILSEEQLRFAAGSIRFTTTHCVRYTCLLCRLLCFSHRSSSVYHGELCLPVIVFTTKGAWWSTIQRNPVSYASTIAPTGPSTRRSDRDAISAMKLETLICSNLRNVIVFRTPDGFLAFTSKLMARWSPDELPCISHQHGSYTFGSAGTMQVLSLTMTTSKMCPLLWVASFTSCFIPRSQSVSEKRRTSSCVGMSK